MDRRTFLCGAGLAALAPSIGALLATSAEAQVGVPVSDVSAHPASGAITDIDPVVFKIDGWDSLESTDSSGNEVSISINQSWRTAWR